MEKKVVILGNGFDLACDLKSRYSDFFENRIDEELVCLLNSTFNDFKDRLSVDGLGFKMIFEIGDYKENKNSEQFLYMGE